MDRRQLVTQRVREFFGERVEDVLHMVRQDRQELRGWEEPAHLRAVVRRSVREQGGGDVETTAVATAARQDPQNTELGRAAGEPDRGQQREAIGQLLEVAGNALEKVARQAANDLSPEETFGLEFALLLYGRPAVLVDDGNLATVPALWNILED